MSADHNKILLLAAHPRIFDSQVVAALFNLAGSHEAVTCLDLYARYPDFDIDIEREQETLIEHDVVIFLFPLFWYSTPSILKEWQDLVLEYGFAYGRGGDALRGKIFLAAISASDSHASFHSSGSNNHTLRELLLPLEQMAARCGMIYLPPFALFNSATAVEEHRMESFVEDWEALLDALASGELDMESAVELTTLNDGIHSILGED